MPLLLQEMALEHRHGPTPILPECLCQRERRHCIPPGCCQRAPLRGDGGSFGAGKKGGLGRCCQVLSFSFLPLPAAFREDSLLSSVPWGGRLLLFLLHYHPLPQLHPFVSSTLPPLLLHAPVYLLLQLCLDRQQILPLSLLLLHYTFHTLTAHVCACIDSCPCTPCKHGVDGRAHRCPDLHRLRNSNAHARDRTCDSAETARTRHTDCAQTHAYRDESCCWWLCKKCNLCAPTRAHKATELYLLCPHASRYAPQRARDTPRILTVLAYACTSMTPCIPRNSHACPHACTHILRTSHAFRRARKSRKLSLPPPALLYVPRRRSDILRTLPEPSCAGIFSFPCIPHNSPA
mmetsp:Transcript_4535/g.9110  ORF Transcript_4535/g.9110 Transcript_4535/m.9110 type:complete len:348 (-) Transcript_4535:442-1485(-)